MYPAFHYRSKMHFFANNWIFWQKYINLGMRNILEIIKKKNLKKIKKIGKFLGSSRIWTRDLLRERILKEEFNLKTLENRAQGANFNQNGALGIKSPHKSIWPMPKCPHCQWAWHILCPKSVWIGFLCWKAPCLNFYIIKM